MLNLEKCPEVVDELALQVSPACGCGIHYTTLFQLTWEETYSIEKHLFKSLYFVSFDET